MKMASTQQKNIECSAVIFNFWRAWAGIEASPPSLLLIDPPDDVSTNFLYLAATTWAYAAGAAAIRISTAHAN
jgi:hypothetical protein